MVIEHTARITNRSHYKIEYEVYYERNIPTTDELAEIQTKLGYNTAGYGGPSNIRCCGHKVAWESFGNCE